MSAAAEAYLSANFDYNNNSIPLGNCSCPAPDNVIRGVLDNDKMQLICQSRKARGETRKHTWTEVTLAGPLHALGGRRKAGKGIVAAYILTFYNSRQLIKFESQNNATDLIEMPVEDRRSFLEDDDADNASAVVAATPTHPIFIFRNEHGRYELLLFNTIHVTEQMLLGSAIDAGFIVKALYTRDRVQITDAIAAGLQSWVPDNLRHVFSGNVLHCAGRYLLDTLMPVPLVRPPRPQTFAELSRGSVASKISFQQLLKEFMESARECGGGRVEGEVLDDGGLEASGNGSAVMRRGQGGGRKALAKGEGGKGKGKAPA